MVGLTPCAPSNYLQGHWFVKIIPKQMKVIKSELSVHLGKAGDKCHSEVEGHYLYALRLDEGVGVSWVCTCSL